MVLIPREVAVPVAIVVDDVRRAILIVYSFDASLVPRTSRSPHAVYAHPYLEKAVLLVVFGRLAGPLLGLLLLGPLLGPSGGGPLLGPLLVGPSGGGPLLGLFLSPTGGSPLAFFFEHRQPFLFFISRLLSLFVEVKKVSQGRGL